MTATSSVYEALPGLSVPLGEALGKLSSMWSPMDESGKRLESEYRASRMNLIVHIGFEASAKEAKQLFQTVIDFSHRYPCRMILLCPQPESWDSESDMSCKIFSECVFGEGSSGMNCCEALILGYTLNDRRFLENQVSVFMEADLPTYYWPTRFGSAQLLSDYKFFFKEAERVLFDSSRECFRIEEVELPQPDKAHDLAYSRLLPIRQGVGQFLSAFTEEAIVDGLKKVSLKSDASFNCEGRALIEWVEEALNACFDAAGKERSKFEVEQSEVDDPVIVMNFEYENDHFVEFSIDLKKSEAHVEADLGNGKQVLTTGVRVLDPQTALAEALFFS